MKRTGLFGLRRVARRKLWLALTAGSGVAEAEASRSARHST